MTNQDRKATRPGADRVTAKGPEMILADATVLTMDEERRAFTSGSVWMKNGRLHRVGPTTELKDVRRTYRAGRSPAHSSFRASGTSHPHLAARAHGRSGKKRSRRVDIVVSCYIKKTKENIVH